MRKVIYIGFLLLAASCSKSTNPTLAFYVVSDQQSANSRFIDTQDLPKLGYISRKPDLEIKSIKEVYPQNGDRGFTLAVALKTEDAKQFAALTERSIDKRLLVMLGDSPLSAPTVRSTIEGGRFGIDFHTQAEQTKTEQELKKLLDAGGG